MRAFGLAHETLSQIVFYHSLPAGSLRALGALTIQYDNLFEAKQTFFSSSMTNVLQNNIDLFSQTLLGFEGKLRTKWVANSFVSGTNFERNPSQRAFFHSLLAISERLFLYAFLKLVHPFPSKALMYFQKVTPFTWCISTQILYRSHHRERFVYVRLTANLDLSQCLPVKSY